MIQPAHPPGSGARKGEFADWLALLPGECAGRLLWVAPPERAVPDDLAAKMQVTTAEHIDDVAGERSFDLVATLAMRRMSDLASLTARLRPGGQLYIEVDRPAAVARPRHLRRHLEGLGYRNVRFFWPLRGFSRPEVFVPLGDRRFQRYYLDRLMWRGALARRGLRSVLAILSQLGLFDAAVPRFIAVASLGEPTTSAAVGVPGTTAGVLEAVRADWSMLVGADPPPDRIGWIVQTAGTGLDRKLICTTWLNEDPEPRAVIKVARTPRADTRVESEHKALGLVHRYAQHPTIQVPRPFGRTDLGGRPIAAESPVPGRPLTAYLDQHPQFVDQMASRWTAWVDWLADLHARSSRPATPAETNDLLFHPLDTLHAELTLEPGEVKAIQRIRRSATDLVDRHPLRVVLAHNDLGPSNVFVSDAGTPVAVIDWESGGFGLPTTDLFYFLARFSDAVANGVRPVPGWDYHSLFLTGLLGTPSVDEGPARLVQDWTQRYQSRLDISSEWLPILFVAGWVMHARNDRRKLIDAHPGTPAQDTFFRRRLTESLTGLDRSWLNDHADPGINDR